jgi:hypothetical protein
LGIGSRFIASTAQRRGILNLGWEGVKKLLTEFDQNTIANMTAALEYVCNKIPADKDGHEVRKRIADAIMACGHAGRRTLVDFQEAGLEVLEEIVRPPRFNWFGLRPKRPR